MDKQAKIQRATCTGSLSDLLACSFCACVCKSEAGREFGTYRGKAAGIGHVCSGTPLQQHLNRFELVALACQVQGCVALPAIVHSRALVYCMHDGLKTWLHNSIDQVSMF